MRENKMSERMEKLRKAGARKKCRTVTCRNKVLVGDIYCEECRENGAIKEESRLRNRRYDLYRRDKESTSFYRSSKWLEVRELVIKRDRGVCQRCKRRGKYPVPEGNVVHHIKELKDRPDLATDESNLEVLCHRCHNEVHSLK